MCCFRGVLHFYAGRCNSFAALMKKPFDFLFNKKKTNLNLKWDRLVEMHKKGGDLSLHYEQIITRILLNGSGPKNSRTKALLVTSAVGEEGKTFTAVNMAAVLAAGGRRTLLVDTSFMEPALGNIFGAKNSPGLVDLLTEDVPFQEAVLRDRYFENLHLLPSGSSGKYSKDLLLSGKFDSLWKDLKSSYDSIVIDGYSLDRHTEPLILGRFVNGVVLVVKCDETQKELVKAARHKIEENRIKITGVVLNRIPKYMPPFY